MDDLEALEAMEAQAAGVTPPVPVQVPEVVEQCGGEEDRSGYELVADLLPVAQHRALGAWCMRYKIGEDDPIFGEKLAAGVAFNSAAAAALAAERVAAGVESIPKTILKGAIQATKSVQGDIAAVLKIGGDAILAAINEAAAAGSDKVKEGSKDLIEKLDQAVEVKKREGVSEFALAASEAATAAAGAASARVISESKVKLRYSLLTMSVIFLIYVGLGAFVGYEYLNLTDRIAPAPMVLNAAGKANCGVIPAPGGGEEKVCQIR